MIGFGNRNYFFSDLQFADADISCSQTPKEKRAALQNIDSNVLRCSSLPSQEEIKNKIHGHFQNHARKFNENSSEPYLLTIEKVQIPLERDHCIVKAEDLNNNYRCEEKLRRLISSEVCGFQGDLFYEIKFSYHRSDYSYLQ